MDFGHWLHPVNLLRVALGGGLPSLGLMGRWPCGRIGGARARRSSITDGCPPTRSTLIRDPTSTEGTPYLLILGADVPSPHDTPTLHVFCTMQKGVLLSFTCP